MKFFDPSFWRYQYHGWKNRSAPHRCPCCNSVQGKFVARKGMHQLWECDECHILFRHPRESNEEMVDFYQEDYAEPGLTTELPNDEALNQLIATKFRGSPKDFSHHIDVLKALEIVPPMRVLDFGANWGYLSFQLRNEGYEVESFEVSKPHAAFGKKLGVEIRTEPSQLKGNYDCIYSCHVLEHVPNPLETVRQQMQWLTPGGLLVAHTPNGSAEWRSKGFPRFQKSWGKVHPVLLTADFVQKNFPNSPLFVTSNDDVSAVREWNRGSRVIECCDDAGLFFAIRKSD